MNIVPFSPECSFRARSFVLGVLSEEGFDYDPLKDSDLDDIESNYIRKGGGFFISFDNGEVVGTSAVRNIGSDICEIKRLYVKKECRGKGLGLALFKAVLEFAKQNYSCARLKTDSSLKKAISMYLQHGFVLLKEDNGTMYFEKSL
ncbi:GNAT family N-acetyltransferase [Methanolobus psychrotolerans]|uniref:GNAT family N-acetyltransferase n=1 Tax=Methanolobus psychrotolerans TaxID=1874706 RepID=UPI000B91CD61|nr:GNAT family N-acetyltransferase [Methanolobus psychrotolerans]